MKAATRTRINTDQHGCGDRPIGWISLYLCSSASLLLLVLCLCTSVAFAQEPKPAKTEPLALSEVEVLRHENLLLRLDAAQKQMALLAAQYRELEAALPGLQAQLRDLEQTILKAHGAEGGSIDWQQKAVIKPTPAAPPPVPPKEGKK